MSGKPPGLHSFEQVIRSDRSNPFRQIASRRALTEAERRDFDIVTDIHAMAESEMSADREFFTASRIELDNGDDRSGWRDLIPDPGRTH